MALPKRWLEPEDEREIDVNDEKTRAALRQPYIVHRSIEEEEHRVEVRDEIRSDGTTWAVSGALLLSFALMCLIFVGQEVRAGRSLMTAFFWTSFVLGSVMLVGGLLRKRSRV